jgi:hypothetical protein
MSDRERIQFAIVLLGDFLDDKSDAGWNLGAERLPMLQKCVRSGLVESCKRQLDLSLNTQGMLYEEVIEGQIVWDAPTANNAECYLRGLLYYVAKSRPDLDSPNAALSLCRKLQMQLGNSKDVVRYQLAITLAPGILRDVRELMMCVGPPMPDMPSVAYLDKSRLNEFETAYVKHAKFDERVDIREVNAALNAAIAWCKNRIAADGTRSGPGFTGTVSNVALFTGTVPGDGNEPLTGFTGTVPGNGDEPSAETSAPTEKVDKIASAIGVLSKHPDWSNKKLPRWLVVMPNTFRRRRNSKRQGKPLRARGKRQCAVELETVVMTWMHMRTTKRIDAT